MNVSCVTIKFSINTSLSGQFNIHQTELQCNLTRNYTMTSITFYHKKIKLNKIQTAT